MNVKMRFILMLFICALNDVNFGMVVFKRYTGTSDVLLDGSFLTLKALSEIKCCLACSQNERCKIVNFHKGTGECQLVAFLPDDHLAVVNSRAGWKMYQPDGIKGSCGNEPEWWNKRGSSCYTPFLSLSKLMPWTESQARCKDEFETGVWQVDEPGEWEYITTDSARYGTNAIYPIQFTTTTDESKGCLPELMRQYVRPATNMSVCGSNLYEQFCPYYEDGFLTLHNCTIGTAFKMVCEKHQIY